MILKYIGFILLIAIITLSGCIGHQTQSYNGINENTKRCYNFVNEGRSMTEQVYSEYIETCNQIETLESTKFYLKEMKQKDLVNGKISGSFLLIGGSVYGTVEEKMYLVVTYFDQRIGSYKITKFNLEQIEINTIDKNESAFFNYKVLPQPTWKFPYEIYTETTARLYLPDGWAII